MEMKSISELKKQFSVSTEYINPNNPNGLSTDKLKAMISYQKARIAENEGKAKKNGEIQDPKWAQYSYEEIIQMEENGVSIPKEVLEIAHAMMDSDPITYEIAINEAEQEQNVEDQSSTEKTDDTSTKKASFYKLIAKTSAKIDLSEQKQEQIKNAINELTPVANEASSLKDRFIDRQKSALEKLKKIVKEWNKIKKKADKGEKLTNYEQKRYEELSKLFEDESKGSQEEFPTNKIKEITKSLQEIDMLSQKGIAIGAETAELGDEIIDFTNPYSNTKGATKNTALNIGNIGSIMAMIVGKKLAQEAISVGTDTKEFSNESQITANEIATILDIQKPLSVNQDTQKTENNEFQNETNTLQNTNNINNSEDTTNIQKQNDIQNKNENTATQVVENTSDSIKIQPTDSSAGGGESATGKNTNANANNIPTSTQSTLSQVDSSQQNSKTTTKQKDETQNVNASNGKEAAKQLKSETPKTKSSGQETEKQSKEMEKCDKETKKTDKKLKKDDKALQKQIKKDEKLLKENEKKVEETVRKIEEEQLEVESMQLQMMALDEIINSGGQSDDATNPTTSFSINNNEGNGTNNATNNSGNNSGTDKVANAIAQSEALKGLVQYKAASIEVNGQKLYTLQNSSSKTVTRMKKTQVQYNKAVKATQKELLKDQQEESKVLKFANKVESICSPIATAGMIVKTVGQILTKVVLPPWIPVVGAVMVPVGATAEAVGNYGVAAANVTKTVCYALEGNLLGALTSAATGIMSGASAISATKQATAGFQNLSKNIAGAQARAAAAQSAKEAAKQGASQATVDGMKNGASQELAATSTEQLTAQAKQGAKLGASEATKQQGLQASQEIMQRTAYESTTSGIKELGKTSFTELAMNASSGLGTLGQALGNNQNNEMAKAQASGSKFIYTPSESVKKIQKSVQTQKVGFANYYSQSNSGGGLNKRR